MPHIRLMRVASSTESGPAREPRVMAIVDDYLVKFSIRDGWTCTCDTDADECQHVDDVDDLLDPRVLGDDR